MKKLISSIFCLGIGIISFACLEKIDISPHPADYQFHQTSLHAKVHWSYRILDEKSLAIEGLVEAWGGEVKLEDILITAVLYDPAGKVMLKQSKRPQRAIINAGELTPFQLIVEFPVKPAKVKIEESYKPVRSY